MAVGSTANFVAAPEDLGARVGAAAGPGRLPGGGLPSVTRACCLPRKLFAALPRPGGVKE